MSTIESYDARPAEAARRRAAREMERRRLEAERLRAEIAAAERARLAAERARLAAERAKAAERRRRAQAEVDRETRRLDGVRERLVASSHATSRELQQVSTELDAAKAACAKADAIARRCERQLEENARRLQHAKEAIRGQIEQLETMQQQAGHERDLMNASIADARRALQMSERLVSGEDAMREVGEALRVGAQATERERELQTRLSRVEAELSFVTARAESAPMAMLTLMSMEQNGYVLREAATRGDLVSYFQRADEAHILAVRIKPIGSDSESVEAWDLMAETFEIAGEGCHGMIEDFDTAINELTDDAVTRRPHAQVLKRDGKRPRRLPSPPRRARTTARRRQRATAREG